MGLTQSLTWLEPSRFLPWVFFRPFLTLLTGFGDIKSSWMTALCLSVGILGTLIAALTLDRVGRRRTLYWGSIVLSIVLFLIGGLFRGALEHPARQNRSEDTRLNSSHSGESRMPSSA